MKKSFVLYQDQYTPIKGLTQEQKGSLLDALFLYQTGEPVPKVDPVVMMAFSFFKQTFDRDQDKYLKRCDKNRENVRKRWDAKDTNVYDGIRPDTKHTDSGNDKIVTVVEDSGNDIKEKDNSIPSGNDLPKKATKRFLPPTLEEVTAYCQEKNNGVDGYTFWNFYEAKDWMLGKNKMKKWKAAIATWKKNVKPVEKWKDPFKSECDAVGPPGEILHDVVAQVKREADERRAKENGLS